MGDIIGIFEQYGLIAIFIGVLVEQLGAPVPAVPFLLLAGAQGASEGVFAPEALLAATAASLIADTLWFLAGRHYGRSVLDILCRVSLSPVTCIRKSEDSFARRGKLSVVIAKFVPGVSTLTPPMAGALRMPLRTFVLLDLAGSLLWAGSGLAAGLVFHEQVHALMQAISAFGSTAALVVAVLAAGYGGWLVLQRVLARSDLRKAARIGPRRLATLMGRPESLLVLHVSSSDLPSHARLPGALQAPLGSAIAQAARQAGPGVRIVLYCDCPADESAVRAARQLARLGHSALVLEGGVRAWTAAGLPLDGDEQQVNAARLASARPAPG